MTTTIHQLITNETHRLSTTQTHKTIHTGLEGFVDFLSSGQWVDEKKYGIAWRKRKMPTPDTTGQHFVQQLTDAGILIRAAKPESTSVRMSAEAVIGWREYRNLSMQALDQGCPRFFDDVIEDDMWDQAPLRRVQMITVTPGEHMDADYVVGLLHSYGAWTQPDENGIIRATCLWGQPLVSELKQTGMIRNVRTTDTWRREVVDIPREALEQMIRFYLTFMKGVFKNHQKTIIEKIGKDSYESQIFYWLMQAIRRYDNKVGVPFGAYIAGQAAWWVNDLNRIGLDHQTAPMQLNAQKAYKVEGTLEEKAATLGVSQKRLNESITVSQRIFAIQHGISLDTARDENSPLHERITTSTTGAASEDVEQVSQLHRRIAQAAIHTSNPNGAIVNIVRFLNGGTINKWGEEIINHLKNDSELRKTVRNNQ